MAAFLKREGLVMWRRVWKWGKWLAIIGFGIALLMDWEAYRAANRYADVGCRNESMARDAFVDCEQYFTHPEYNLATKSVIAVWAGLAIVFAALDGDYDQIDWPKIYKLLGLE